MLIEKNAQYYLKRTRAFAKEIEFDIPEHLRTKKEVDINELFPVVIGCIADLSADIVRGENVDKQVDIHKKELYFASKFYDSYINLRVTDISAEKNYFYLVGAIAYYLCDQIGSSMVLIKHIDKQTLNLSKNELDILLYHLLKNDVEINDKEILNSCNSKYMSEFINKYNSLMTHGLTLDFQFIKEFRQSVYDTNDCRDIFLIDALLAIFILKAKHSVFEMLPKYSYIELNDLVDIINSGHFVRELWPSQRFMCEKGFFKGESGVVQMPTGSGKTKAMSMAIYSAFCSGSVRLSVVVAPFRALCREISTDLRHDLEFNNDIQISEVSDLIQEDYLFDELFNPERKTVVVTTPEKLLYIVRQDESILSNIGQLIFDEGHLFDDEERGATYELLISSILKQIDFDVQKILISAIIPNVDQINNWFTKGNGIAFSDKNISIVEKLPATLKWEKEGRDHYGYLYYVSNEDYVSPDFYVPRMIEIKPLARRSREKQKYFPSVDFSHKKMIEKNDMAIACLLKIIPHDNVAIFCGRKDSANKILERILDLNKRGYDVSGLKKRADVDEINKISNLIEKNYGNDVNLYQAAKLGLFVHHAGISDSIKTSVEYALRESKITNVICTSTLAQGVNLPIKYLVISSIYQAGERIKVRDFHNLIGRTARSGMFTEGTIIFSDPFAYGDKDQWAWNQCRELLNPNNSESCTSAVLDVVREYSTKNRQSFCLFNATILRYTDYKKFQESEKIFLNKYSQNVEIIKIYNHILSVLARIESYIALEIANNDNTYTEEFVVDLLNNTLANSIATETQRCELKLLFEKICEYLSNILEDESDKRSFSRSMISSEAYIKLTKDVNEIDIGGLTSDELLEFIIETAIRYSKPRCLDKVKDRIARAEIAKMWMEGQSYYSIKMTADERAYKINKKNRGSIVTMDEIFTICNIDFGYIISLLINSICEILKVNGNEEEGLVYDAADRLQEISLKLKYGLPTQTDIFIYELGFNDRFLAQEMHKKIGEYDNKKDVKKAIKEHFDEIELFLKDYPLVFQYRLNNL